MTRHTFGMESGLGRTRDPGLADYHDTGWPTPVHPAPPEKSAPMTLDDYQRTAAQTAMFPGRGAPLGLIYCALKLAGEAGEVAEKVGKGIRDGGLRLNGLADDGVAGDGTPAPRLLGLEDAIAHELGDVLWYVAMCAAAVGYDLGEIAAMNVTKLASRQARGVIGGSGDNR